MPEAFPVWLRRIVTKYCDRINRRKQLKTVSLEDAGHIGTTQMSPDKILIDKELEKRVMAAIAELPERQQTATTLYYVDGYSQKEVAEFMEVPLTTVKKRLHQAKKEIRAIMLYKERD